MKLRNIIKVKSFFPKLTAAGKVKQMFLKTEGSRWKIFSSDETEWWHFAVAGGGSTVVVYLAEKRLQLGQGNDCGLYQYLAVVIVRPLQTALQTL